MNKILSYIPIFTKSKFYSYLKIGKYRIYFTTHALRKKPKTLKKNSWKKRARAIKIVEQDGKCRLCGCPIKDQTCSLHHIKPVSAFPELKRNIDNVVLLCHHCHQAIHAKATMAANIHLANAKIF